MNREILRLAIPNVISNISLPLLSTVDTALMGHLSSVHIGAIGLATMIFNFIYWNFGFLRMGTTGIVAQYHGAHQYKETTSLLLGALFIAGLIGVVLILGAPFLLELASYFLNIEVEHFVYVEQYTSIRVFDAPATIGLYVFMGWYFGRQNSWVPLIVTLLINSINILLSVYFVQSLEWGIEGVAKATVIAQYSGLISMLCIYVFRDRMAISFEEVRIYWSKSKIKRFFSVNKDLFIRTVCLTLSFAYLYSIASDGGEIDLAVNVIILQILSWISYGIDGFAFAAESIIGKYYGANDHQSLRKGIHLSFRWGFLVALSYAIVLASFNSAIITIYTDDQDVILRLKKLSIILWVLPLVSFWCYIWDGIFIGLTQSRYMMYTMILSLFLFVFTHQLFLGTHFLGIWISFLLFFIYRSAFLWWSYKVIDI